MTKPDHTDTKKTTAATRARIEKKDRELAERLRSHGWECIPPSSEK